MDKYTNEIGIALLLAGLGVIYVSRLLLFKRLKMTGNELEKLDPELEGIHQTYTVLNIVTMSLVGLFLFLIYRLNPTFWEERFFILSIPFFAAFALFDALFALRTKVFPATTRHNWNNYVYDRDDRLRWIAFWQIGLSLLLLVIDGVILIFTL